MPLHSAPAFPVSSPPAPAMVAGGAFEMPRVKPSPTCHKRHRRRSIRSNTFRERVHSAGISPFDVEARGNCDAMPALLTLLVLAAAGFRASLSAQASALDCCPRLSTRPDFTIMASSHAMRGAVCTPFLLLFKASDLLSYQQLSALSRSLFLYVQRYLTAF